MEKTLLITIISDHQTNIKDKVLLHDSINNLDVCFQNLLFSNNQLEFDNVMFKNLVILDFSSEARLECSKTKRTMVELNMLDASIPIFILLNEGSQDTLKVYCATYNLVPDDWGGECKFFNLKNDVHLEYLQEELLLSLLY